MTSVRLHRAAATVGRRSPLIRSLLCCLGIQGGLLLVLMGLSRLAEPGGTTPSSTEAIVRVKDDPAVPEYVAVSLLR